MFSLSDKFNPDIPPVQLTPRTVLQAYLQKTWVTNWYALWEYGLWCLTVIDIKHVSILMTGAIGKHSHVKRNNQLGVCMCACTHACMNASMFTYVVCTCAYTHICFPSQRHTKYLVTLAIPRTVPVNHHDNQVLLHPIILTEPWPFTNYVDWHSPLHIICCYMPGQWPPGQPCQSDSSHLAV